MPEPVLCISEVLTTYVWQAIETSPDHDALDPQAVFGTEWAALGAAAVAWKKEKGIANQGSSLVPADAASVSPISIAALERIQLHAAAANPQVSLRTLHFMSIITWLSCSNIN
jgi:hypothetical protein